MFTKIHFHYQASSHKFKGDPTDGGRYDISDPHDQVLQSSIFQTDIAQNAVELRTQDERR